MALHECDAIRAVKIVEQLLLAQVVNLMMKVVANAPDGTGIGIDGFGTQAFEFKC
jgi:hypothetical protein